MASRAGRRRGKGPGSRPPGRRSWRGRSSAIWTTRLLADYLDGATGHRAGIEAARLALHRLGFVCKRPGWSLKRKATEQPGWAKNGSGWRRS